MAHASPFVARALTAICLGATATTVLSAAPVAAEPSVDQAESKVDKLSHDRKVVAKKAQTTRKNLVEARLAPLAAAKGLDLETYVARLGIDAAERQKVVDALTINETSWFRDHTPYQAALTLGEP